jgi:AcrR family transcriptional regulator
MSENHTDRRIIRTRDRLGDALIALMQERPFDDITVQQVLDRAGIGRSTFYAHYRDKNDLLLSDVEDFFNMMGNLLHQHEAGRERLAPVRELFAHVSSAKEIRAAFVASGKMQDVLDLGRGILARSIEQRLAAAGVAIDPALLKAHAYALAGTLFALLEWWIDRGANLSPDAMDAMFHHMAWAGLGGDLRTPVSR